MSNGPKTRSEEIRERAEKATKGPWLHDGLDRLSEDEGFFMGVVVHDSEGKFENWIARIPCESESNISEDHPQETADSEFIAHARADIPYLLEINADLLAALEASQAEFYRLLDCVGPEDADIIDRRIEVNRAAIARAKGQSQ